MLSKHGTTVIMLTDYQRRVRQKLKDDFSHFASKCLMVRSKEGEIMPFVLNQVQRYIHDKVEQQKQARGRIRCIVLKGRQQGCSTYVEGRFYWLVIHRFGVRAFILTHSNEATNNLYEMAQRYHEHCPLVLRPRVETHNAKELSFTGLDSGYKLGTAGNKAVGRSSTIQLLHGSEVALWPNAEEHAKGIMQSVPNANGTEIFLESTARGLGNYFHEQWQLAESGSSDFMPLFIPWFWQQEYRLPITDDEFILDDEEKDLKRLYGLSDEQLNWRRYKIIDFSSKDVSGRKSFMQEYPNTALDAFQITGEDTYISPNTVMNARKTVTVDAVGSLYVGVDPARYGDDRTSIIKRRGRLAYDLKSYSKLDTMEIVGIVHRIIIDDSPSKVCIDIGNLGAGVYDRLKELGHGDVCVAVNFGAHALNAKRYYNKRAEMWGLMKEWLLDAPVKIPDSDTLHADLCTIRYKSDSKERLVLEKKEDMKRRGIRSPDEGDALALTFASLTPVNKQYEGTAKNIMSTFNKVNRLKKSAYS